jgi:hypothetical protein
LFLEHAARTIGVQTERQEVTPMYRTMGRTHAALHALGLRLRREAGQGTVEYVALILLVALVMAGVVAAMKGFKTDEGKDLGDTIVKKIKEAVDQVQF